jgi:hypothetical protein
MAAFFLGAGGAMALAGSFPARSGWRRRWR